MSDEELPVPKPRNRLRRATRVLLVLCMIISLVVIGQTFFVLNGSKIALPSWVSIRLETALSDSLGGRKVKVGRSEISLENGFKSKFTLHDVQLFAPDGHEQLALDHVQTDLIGRDIINRTGIVRQLRVSGVRMRFSRDRDGRFDFQLGEQGRGSGSLQDLTRAFNESLSAQSSGGLEQVLVSDVSLLFEDEASNRAWLVDEGFIRYEQNAGAISFDMDLPFTSTEGALSGIKIGYDRINEDSAGTVALALSDVVSNDLAAMSKAVAWLELVDAPISGSMRMSVGQDGSVGGLDAALELGHGFLIAGQEKFGFQNGKTYFTYNSDEQVVDFSTISFESDTATIESAGHLFIDETNEELAFLGQLSISKLSLNPKNLFDSPREFDGGQLEFRVIADPFRFHVGQLLLRKGDIEISGKGRTEVGDDGWSTAIDLNVNKLDHTEMLDLWPVSVVPGTRKWLLDNIASGQVTDGQASVRLTPNKPTQSRVTFDIEKGKLRFMPFMPMLNDIYGHGSFENEKFALFLSRGHVKTPFGDLSAKESTLKINDVRRPPIGKFDLNINGPVDAATFILDQKPLNVFKKANRSSEIGQGLAIAKVKLEVPFKKGSAKGNVKFHVDANVQNIVTDTLIPKRTLTAKTLKIVADQTLVTISGKAKLDTVPMTATWEQNIGPDTTGQSSVVGKIELSQNTVNAFHLGLPEGSVSGLGVADFSLALAPDVPPILDVSSDLKGVGVNISAIGWDKPAKSTGELAVKGILGVIAEFPEFSLAAAGLTTSGSISLNADGLLREMVLNDLKVGNWLNTNAKLIGRGAAVPQIVLEGGHLDIRGLPFASEVKGEGGPIDLAVDELIITDSIKLTGFRGEFSSKAGMSGAFRGKVNGGGLVQGSLVPTAGGAAIQVISDQAGETLKSAGVFQSASGGRLNLTLRPRTASQTYDGNLSIKSIRLKEAPAVASLLSAISVVGLLDQLGGEGILFADVIGKFQLTPDQILVQEASAVGPAMGISADGVYDLASGVMNFQGVVSPIYVLNGLGQIFSRNREGLFGFNYRLQGTRDNATTNVNPLSILTPGIFRDIFRQPPPKRQE